MMYAAQKQSDTTNTAEMRSIIGKTSSKNKI